VVRGWSARHSFTVVIAINIQQLRKGLQAANFGPCSHLPTPAVEARYGARRALSSRWRRFESGRGPLPPQFLGGVDIPRIRCSAISKIMVRRQSARGELS
jgi:hypothetical protein